MWRRTYEVVYEGNSSFFRKVINNPRSTFIGYIVRCIPNKFNYKMPYSFVWFKVDQRGLQHLVRNLLFTLQFNGLLSIIWLNKMRSCPDFERILMCIIIILLLSKAKVCKIKICNLAILTSPRQKFKISTFHFWIQYYIFIRI